MSAQQVPAAEARGPILGGDVAFCWKCDAGAQGTMLTTSGGRGAAARSPDSRVRIACLGEIGELLRAR
jgi:hypothetical protein